MDSIDASSRPEPMNSSGVAVRVADEADLIAITQININAMPLDPEYAYRFPYRNEYPQDHFDCCLQEHLAILRDRQALVLVAEMASLEPPHDIVPVAFGVWHYPGSPTNAMPDVVGKADSTSPAQALVIRRDASLARMAAFRKSITRAKSEFFDDVYGSQQLYLGTLACHCSYQRRGAGSALIAAGLERARDSGMTITLCASPMGVPLYTKMGFKEVGNFHTQVDGEEEFIDTPCLVFSKQ